MNAGLDTGPVQLWAVAVAVLDPDFRGIFSPLIQIVEAAPGFILD